MSETTKSIGVVLLAAAFVPSAAWAYVDPGSGYMIWQLVLSLFAGVAFFFRRGMFRRASKKPVAVSAPERKAG